jgi:archaellum component FlaC
MKSEAVALALSGLAAVGTAFTAVWGGIKARAESRRINIETEAVKEDLATGNPVELLRRAIDGQAAVIDDLRQQIEDQQARLVALDREFDAVVLDRDTLRRENRELRIRVANLEDQVERLKMEKQA